MIPHSSIKQQRQAYKQTHKQSHKQGYKQSYTQKFFEFRTFTKNIKETGAIFALPRHIVNEITMLISKQKDRQDKKEWENGESRKVKAPFTILELGAGPGNITKELCKQFPQANIIIYEINGDFCNLLQNTLGHYNNCDIRQQSAEDIIQDIKPETIDVIISTLPLSTMGMIGDIILKTCHQKLKSDGIFVTAQYRTKQNKKISHYIGPQVTSKKKWTFFPPVHVSISSFQKVQKASKN